MPMFSVFGAGGFVGSNLVEFLVGRGHEVHAYARGEWPERRHLGHAIYAIGKTANFRGFPLETAEAHVEVLLEALRRFTFDSLLYLSSTRVYLGSVTADETTKLCVDPVDPDCVYNATKLAGEAVCLSLNAPTIRVGRLSNVVGDGAPAETFIPSLVSDALRTGKAMLRSSLSSAKDYVGVEDVCLEIENIALTGSQRLYNIASGASTTNGSIAGLLRDYLGADVSTIDDAREVRFPDISVERFRSEFDFVPQDFSMVLRDYIERQRRRYAHNNR